MKIIYQGMNAVGRTWRGGLCSRLCGAALLCAVLLAGCAKDPAAETPELGGEGGEVTVQFTFKPEIIPEIEVKSVAGADENTIKDIWVIQLNTAGTAQLQAPKYISSLTAIGNSYQAYLTLQAQSGKVYFIANTGNSSLYTSATTQALIEAKTLEVVSESSLFTNSMTPMSGVWTGTPGAMGIEGNVPLTRAVSKVTLKLSADLPSGETFKPTAIQVRQVPNTLQYFRDPDKITTGMPYPTLASGQTVDYAADKTITTALTATPQTLTWYVPENARGTGTATAQHEKADASLMPSGQSAYCTYIEIAGDYLLSGSLHNVFYRIYLGADNTSDYNLLRNRNYTLNTVIKGINEADTRVEDLGFNLSKNGTANCYIASEAGVTYSFDATKQGNGVGTDDAVLAAIDPKSAKVFWQTGKVVKDGSVTLKNKRVFFDIDPSFSPSAGGSALIAVYASSDGSGDPLWSWHIWGTDYNPDGTKTYGLADNSKAAVPGGEVHTYGDGYMIAYSGKVVMDRSLGADRALYALATGTDDNWPTYGFLYQWGRKDPFPGAKKGATGDDVAIRPLFAPDGTTDITSSAFQKVDVSGSGPKTFAEVVASPGKYYHGTGDWITPPNDNWWNSTSGKKTAYDPCPPGWRVPDIRVWGDFDLALNCSIQGIDQEAGPKSGLLYKAGAVSTWFPAAGARSSFFSGELCTSGQTGYYWMSTPGTHPEACLMNFVFGDPDSYLYNGYTDYRDCGMSVRCVQE